MGIKIIKPCLFCGEIPDINDPLTSKLLKEFKEQLERNKKAYYTAKEINKSLSFEVESRTNAFNVERKNMVRFITYVEHKCRDQKLPLERKLVLVQLQADKKVGSPIATVVGYLKYAKDYMDVPYFVTPGYSRGTRAVIAWSDCLPKEFKNAYLEFKKSFEDKGN